MTMNKKLLMLSLMAGVGVSAAHAGKFAEMRKAQAEEEAKRTQTQKPTDGNQGDPSSKADGASKKPATETGKSKFASMRAAAEKEEKKSSTASGNTPSSIPTDPQAALTQLQTALQDLQTQKTELQKLSASIGEAGAFFTQMKTMEDPASTTDPKAKLSLEGAGKHIAGFSDKLAKLKADLETEKSELAAYKKELEDLTPDLIKENNDFFAAFMGENNPDTGKPFTAEEGAKAITTIPVLTSRVDALAKAAPAAEQFSSAEVTDLKKLLTLGADKLTALVALDADKLTALAALDADKLTKLQTAAFPADKKDYNLMDVLGYTNNGTQVASLFERMNALEESKTDTAIKADAVFAYTRDSLAAGKDATKKNAATTAFQQVVTASGN